MGDVVNKLFGGTDDSAQKATIRQNDMSREYIQQQYGQARNDISSAYNPMSQALSGGFGSAMDAYNQAAPRQLDAMSQGNFGAQQQIMAGLPAFQAALMGQPVDMGSVFQPQRIAYDPAMFQRQLPQTPQYSPQGASQPQREQFNPLGGGY